MKALIAMSGGVDSSVAAYLAQREGYECIGCTMKLYTNTDAGISERHTCCSLDDVEDARAVAYRLGMRYGVFNFSEGFREQVMLPFCDAYRRARTPNPCIECNRRMKFDALFRRAEELSCEKIVTGHYAPGVVTGLISAAIICATMSSADSNLLCMSTMIINDLYTGLGGKKKLTDKQTIFYTRACNVLSAVVAILISLANVSIVAMNTFAFGIRCAGPFAAYGLGLAVPKATKNSGVVSIICGTVAFVVWQIVGGGGTWMFLMPVVAGCLVSTVSFYVVNWIEWARGVEPAPSAYLSDEEVTKKIAEETAGR